MSNQALPIKIGQTMLVLSESIYKRREKIGRDLDAGKPLTPALCAELLKLDPWDYVALLELARVRKESGDLAGAEELCWRVIEAHPGMPIGYQILGEMLYERQENPLADAMGHLAIAKGLVDEEGFEKISFLREGVDEELVKGIREMSTGQRSRVIAELIAFNRKSEPEEVTGRMKALRLLDDVQAGDDLDRETVDAMIEIGPAMAPLLIGLLRDCVQGSLVEEDEAAFENATALLGEVGRPEDLEPLLELVEADIEEVGSSANWAVGRILERHPAESVEFLLSAPQHVQSVERRVTIAFQLNQHSGVDPDGRLVDVLLRNVSKWSRDEKEKAFPMVLTAAVADRGPGAVARARAVFARERHALTRDTRDFCEYLLDNLADNPPPAEKAKEFTIYEICAGTVIWNEEDEDEDLDDDELDDDELDDEFEDDEFENEIDDFELPQQPVRKAAAPGRNDPCWCNSGKKYKKCHLESDERERLGEGPQAVNSIVGDRFQPLRERIAKTMRELMPPAEVSRAVEEFFDNEFSGWLKPEEIEPDPIARDLTVMDWAVHDRVLPGRKHTVIEEFLKRHGSSLSSNERQMTEAWSRSFFGLYEVLETKPGTGFEVKDLITGEKNFVHDISGSKSLHRWDVVFSRLIPGDRGTEVTGTALLVIRQDVTTLREWMEDDRNEQGLEWPVYLKRNWPRIRGKVFKLARERMEGLVLKNTDDEQLVLSKAVYETKDGADAAPDLIGKFNVVPGLERESGDDFVWMNESKTVLGHIRIEGRQVTVECNSKERLERGKELVERVADAGLRHVRDQFTSQAELKRGALERKPAPPRNITAAEREAVTQVLERHYDTWIDMSIPALGGKTPREAALTPAGRDQLIELLKDLENGEERNRQAGEPYYDVTRLRKVLKLNP
jgi:hypothetical protein